MISIHHVEKKYPDGTPLKDINAEINKGDVISLIGPSGTGKSTLLRCINMLDPPTKGQIFVDGVDVTDKKTDLRKIRHKLGMVFQSYNLYSHKTVIENLMMGPVDLLGLSKQEAFDRGVGHLKSVGLGEKLYAYPDELSGGQKQRVAIARCLAMKPEIILFDEPTSALDPTMVGEVQAVIRKLAAEGHTMVIVSHDMKFSREIANRVFYMDQGVIYEEGTPEQIFEHSQRERTRAFVKRLKTLEYKITSRDFDLYEMNGKIEEFAKVNYMSQRQLNNIQLVLEELIVNNLIAHTEDISVGLRFYEVDGVAELDLFYGGGRHNPLDKDEDSLSMLLVRRLTSDCSYSFEGTNSLTLRIKSDPVK